jgi:hypothetical protein
MQSFSLLPARPAPSFPTRWWLGRALYCTVESTSISKSKKAGQAGRQVVVVRLGPDAGLTRIVAWTMNRLFGARACFGRFCKFHGSRTSRLINIGRIESLPCEESRATAVSNIQRRLPLYKQGIELTQTKDTYRSSGAKLEIVS